MKVVKKLTIAVETAMNKSRLIEPSATETVVKISVRILSKVSQREAGTTSCFIRFRWSCVRQARYSEASSRE